MAREAALPTGGSTFAEDPLLAAPDARLVWDASLDPGTLVVEAVPARRGDPDAIVLEAFARWLTIVEDPQGAEHAVVSDGLHHVRLDLAAGTLRKGPVVLHYRIAGSVSARPMLLPLRRIVEFWLHRRFAASLFPRDPRVDRWIVALRVHDALVAGASQREIADVLFGAERAAADWDGASDSLRSRMRRLVGEARRLARGGYRSLMRGSR